jgi:ferredoxin-NADP reductase
VSRIRVSLKRREEVAAGTFAFTFDYDGHPFSFVPGQAVDVFLVDPPHPDPRGPQHPFSIAGTAGPNTIQIATRIRESVWKKNLLEMPLGGPIEIEAAWGEFVLPKEPGDVVMLAGGIGVTPFRAIVEDASARSLPHDLALIHSNRTPEETPFLAQLKRWTTANHRFTYLPTMTQMEKSHEPWVGVRGRIDAAFLDEVLDDHRNEARYMVAGPKGFVDAAVAALHAVGVQPDRILAEDFPGY